MAERYFCYTDGGCKKTPGEPGGWGVFIKRPDGLTEEKHGSAIQTSNTAMELTAILEALRALPDQARAVVFSDSRSALDFCSNWLEIWKRSDWRNAEPSNVELFKAIDRELGARGLQIEWTWIRGHNDNAGNERADFLAGLGAREAKATLKRMLRT